MLNRKILTAIDDQFSFVRYRLPIFARRLVYVAMKKTEIKDGKIQTAKFWKKDFIDILEAVGVTIKNSGFNKVLEQSCKNLLQQVLNIDGSQLQTAFPLMTHASFDKKTNAIELRFHDEMKPFFAHMRNTPDSDSLLLHGICLTSPYSVRLYELFRRKVSLETTKFMPAKMTVAEVRKFLDLGNKYPKPSDLQAHVLGQAEKEFRKKTDITLTYYSERQRTGRGRPIESWMFYVRLIPKKIKSFEDIDINDDFGDDIYEFWK